MKRLILAFALALAADPAIAGTAVTLKADTVSADPVITLGDLFDGAGPAGRVAVGQRAGAAAVLDANIVQAAARRAGLDWANAEGLRRIVVRGTASGGPGVAARGNVEVLTYARSLAAGEIVQPQDLVWAKVAAAPADGPSDADQVIGLAARRPLRAGAVAALRDVSAPQVVKAGDLVTVTFEDGGISLTLQGKAMAAGALGEPVTVQNTNSKKTIQAVITGPDQAAVGPEADRMKSPVKYALR
jgi:flagella basal body P-ring formation protein FlgA